MLIVIIVLINISVVSASEVSDTNQTVLSSQEDIPEYPDLVDSDYTYVYSSTIDNFFTKGVLNPQFKDKNLAFSGDFNDLGQLEIACDNVSITGFNANLKNTVFMLTGNKITLNNINFILNRPVEDNSGAGVYVQGSDISLVNLTMNYIVPTDKEAYAIYVEGSSYEPIENLRIVGSSIYFEGHNDNVKKYNCALKLFNAPNAVLENNTIVTSLPLKEIDYTPTGANLDSSYVYSVGMEGCDGLLFNNNTVIADVNKRPAIEFPTMDCMVISQSSGVVISNNSISMTDFVTYPGIENYIYGIEAHDLKDLWIVNNSISMVTTGGKLALGTAYPIQISGPAKDVHVEYNDLYSFSNGPNIGVYSQCYYGETYVSIKNNKINVTGLAGTHDWALVTGIESQDTFAEILDNQIEVHSIADVGIDDNLYAISYRQSISGPNSFDIENNIAMTDGYYAVYILGSSYSTIAGNTLISFNDNVANGDDSYRAGSRTHDNEDNYDNKVIRAIDYFSQRNGVDNGNIIDVGTSTGSNNIDTSSLSGQTRSDDAISNPLIPGFNDLSGITNRDNDDYNGFIDDGSVQDMISEDQNTNNNNGEEGSRGVESDGSVDVLSDGSNLGIISNSTSSSSSVGVSNNPLNGGQSSAAGDAKSVSKKAYEIEEMAKKENFIPSTFVVLIALFLLIVGYSRKKEYV